MKKINLKNILSITGIIIILSIHKIIWEFHLEINTNNVTFLKRIMGLSAGNILFYFFIIPVQFLIPFSIRALFENYEEKKKRKELEAANLKSELNLLRSQVNPHFIFNSLNNIDTLILKDPGKASDLLIKLSDEIRYMLYDANIDKIVIKEEIGFLKNYISLYEIRINHQNPVDIQIDIDDQKEKIPPMLFIPLVENAFKHGIFTNTSDQVKIDIKVKSKK